MNGQLALMATLAAIGGRWLRGSEDAPAPEFLRSNSSFQYVSAFNAETPRRGVLRRASIAASPEVWLRDLRARGFRNLSLLTDLSIGGPLPRHIASSFSNSGTWALLATGRPAPEIWAMRWHVIDRNAASSRIWAVAATSGPGAELAPPHVSVAEARHQLKRRLQEIRSFAEQADEVSEWANWFIKAEDLLRAADPVPPYHADLLPPGTTLEHRQLAAAVIQGWVFGGMGSWNDSGCSDPATQRESERVGANLYTALLVAIAAAANDA